VTGAHLAYAFISSNAALISNPGPKERIRCVMYCGPSNKSVDVVLGKITFDVVHFTLSIFKVKSSYLESLGVHKTIVKLSTSKKLTRSNVLRS